jgi:hypothetical protein
VFLALHRVGRTTDAVKTARKFRAGDKVYAYGNLLAAYIDAAGIAEDRKGWLYRTRPRHNATVLTEAPMNKADAWRLIRRRAAAAGIFAPIGNHAFRATGITA